MDLNKFSTESYIIAQTRQDNGGNINTDPLQMLKHCATEVIEATEAYTAYNAMQHLIVDPDAIDLEEKWAGMEEPDACEESLKESTADFEKELADIISCCAIIAGKENIDLEKALTECYERNKARAERRGDKL